MPVIAHNKLILAGDIGGTKTLLMLAEMVDGAPRAVREARYENSRFTSLENILAGFLEGCQRPSAACLAVAGPIEGRQARLTNLPWLLDADALEKKFCFERVVLINDFVATGYGIEALTPADMVTLQPGKPVAGAPRAVLGAGTGLGECILVWCNGCYEVMASEGGHVDFAPADEQQIGLLRNLQSRFGHVSYERILSGAGLAAIHAALCAGEADARPLGDPAGITAAAVAGDARAMRALEMFISIYGAQAGNLALTCLARGGVFIAGGIAPRIIEKMREGGFMRAFLDKGRHSRIMAELPVHVIMNPDVGLLGAAVAAGRA